MHPTTHSLTLPVSNFGVGINVKGASAYIGVLIDILIVIDSFLDLEEDVCALPRTGYLREGTE